MTAIASATVYTLGGTGGIGLANREDLSNIIYNISPTKTPFMSMAAREPVKATFHEWNIDALASADTGNAQIGGDDYTLSAIVATTRPGNYTQISNKVFGVSGTQEVVDKAGKRSEMAYQTAKHGFELRRDIEAIIVSADQVAAPGNTTTTGQARNARALRNWMSTDAGNNVSGGGETINTAGTTIAATGVIVAGSDNIAFVDTMINTISNLVWSDGGDPSILMVNSGIKTKISGFAGATGLTQNIDVQHSGSDVHLFNKVDVYVGDFFDLRIVPNRFMTQNQAFMLDMSMWAVGFLRPFSTVDLAKIGDSDRKAIQAEWTLVSRNEEASGMMSDVA